MQAEVIHDDCLVAMRRLAAEGRVFQSVVTDPPYHLIAGGFNLRTMTRNGDGSDRTGQANYAAGGFMGQAWDGGDIAMRPETWRLAYDLLPPGGHLLAFGSTRTYHRLVCAIEDAGLEIRDTICWHYGSGFPKSRNVSRDLRSLPACRCGIAEVPGDDGRVEDAAAPPGGVGTRVGTESVSVLPARAAADEACGLRLQAGAVPFRRQAAVQERVEELVGQQRPVVLRAPDVARVADREEVGGFVGGVEVEPESLRDEVVRDKTAGGPAVGATSVTGDDLCGAVEPTAPLVLPLASAPSGIAGAAQSVGVSGSHASFRTVYAGRAALPCVGDESAGAGSADVLRHANEYDAVRAGSISCSTCGGVRAEYIPEGLGTALKPATELICVARKPLAGIVAETVQRYGTGAINVDACRVHVTPEDAVRTSRHNSAGKDYGEKFPGVYGNGHGAVERGHDITAGRWPANVIWSKDEEEYELRDDVTPERKRALFQWMHENA